MKYTETFKEYLDMLSYKRPAWSKTEEEYIAKFIRPLGAVEDGIGNLYLTINHTDGTAPTTMFTSHTDSVHRTEGRQHIVITDDVVSVTKNEECLGADDATGNYIMMTMIRNDVPGLYVFFRAEEIGGIGSDHAVSHETYWEGYTKCVSFDRTSDLHSVITRQGWGACASDAFAQELADRLYDNTKIDYCPDDTGIFTDSANFVDVIAECTNISVGYQNEHSHKEIQNLTILGRLIEAMPRMCWDTLPVVRDPLLDSSEPWVDEYMSLQPKSGNASKLAATKDDKDLIDYCLSDPEFDPSLHLDLFCNTAGIPGLYDDVLNLIASRLDAYSIPATTFDNWWILRQNYEEENR
jgi:hypothetical protein